MMMVEIARARMSCFIKSLPNSGHGELGQRDFQIRTKASERAIITTDANELVADIHDRMPLILPPGDYACGLGEASDPRDLMRPFPALENVPGRPLDMAERNATLSSAVSKPRIT